MRIDPSDLATFLAIARHRSFRAAATELGVSASALSHALRNIEERLDLRLINRTTRSVALTEAGERLFSRISPAFRDIDDALEDLNNFRGKPAGTLRFNAARQSTQLVLLPIVTRFLKSYPDVSVEIVINDALIDMVSAGFDAGVQVWRDHRRRHDRGRHRSAASLRGGRLARLFQNPQAADDAA